MYKLPFVRNVRCALCIHLVQCMPHQSNASRVHNGLWFGNGCAPHTMTIRRWRVQISSCTTVCVFSSFILLVHRFVVVVVDVSFACNNRIFYRLLNIFFRFLFRFFSFVPSVFHFYLLCSSLYRHFVVPPLAQIC